MSNLKTQLLFAALAVAMASCARDSDLIEPGNRLKVRFSGPGYSVSQLSVVESNGTILLGNSAPVRVQGLSTNEASKALCASLCVLDGKTNAVRDASVQKIAPLPTPLALSVFQSDGSNLIFRLTNLTTNSFRLPSTGYVPSDSYAPINTNPSYARFDKPEVHIGLWLTRDWRHVGHDWMMASLEAWKERLRIRILNPGEHLDVSRSIGPFADDITGNTVIRFNFQISQEWAESCGLWEGNISVTGLAKQTTK